MFDTVLYKKIWVMALWVKIYRAVGRRACVSLAYEETTIYELLHVTSEKSRGFRT